MAFRWLPAENFEANLAADMTIDKSETAAVTLFGVNPALSAAPSPPTSIPAFPVSRMTAASSRVNPYVSYASFCAKGLAGNTYCYSPDTYNKNWGTNLTLDWKLAPDLAV